MTPRAAVGRLLLLVCAIAVASLGGAPRAEASCNLLPGAKGDFRGALGTANTPFASPGDVVGVTIRPGICDDASPGFSSDPAEQVVTVLFDPPDGAPQHAVVVADDCTGIDLTTCNGDLGGASPGDRAACVPAALDIRLDEDGRRQLFFPFPDTDLLFGGAADGRTLSGPARIGVTRAGDPLRCGDLASQRCADRGDFATSGLLACFGEFYLADGTCRDGTAFIDATFPHFTALPIPNDYAGLCQDDPPAVDGPCEATDPELRFTSDSAGNLYLPFDYARVLVEDDGVPVARVGQGSASIPAEPGGPNLRFPKDGVVRSLSPDGFPLAPVFTPIPDDSEDGTLVGTIDAVRAVTRIARRSALFRQCVDFPDVACAEDADCATGVCGDATCRGGSLDGQPCATGFCPDGACGPALFDFSTRYSEATQPGEKTGPIVVGDFELFARVPVPLSGLNETDDIFAFVLNEDLDEVGDANGNQDGDAGDFVVTLASAQNGAPQPLGPEGEPGQAVSRFFGSPFLFPGVAVEDDFVAYLLSETHEGFADANADRDAVDSLARVVQLGDHGELLADRYLAALPSPVVNDQPLVLSEGQLFLVAPERSGVPLQTDVASLRPDNEPAAGNSSTGVYSETGRYVAFDSGAPDLVDGDTNNVLDVFVRDRDTDEDGLFDEPGAVETVRVSVDSDGNQVAGLIVRGSESPDISADGRHVAFTSPSPGFYAFDLNLASDVFVHDRDADGNGIFDEPGGIKTTIVSVDDQGNTSQLFCSGARLGSTRPFLSADGRFVVFDSFAPLVPDDTNGDCMPGETAVGLDVYVHDRDADDDGIFDEPGATSLRRISLPTGNGPEAVGKAAVSTPNSSKLLRELRPLPMLRDAIGALAEVVSDDGRFVLFESLAAFSDLDEGGCVDSAAVPEDCLDVYLRDRDSDGDGEFDEDGDALTILVSRPRNDSVFNDGPSRVNDLSPDGRYAVFSSQSSQLVDDDTNGVSDVFVFDRITGEVTRESVGFGGREVNGPSALGRITPDGRLLAFASEATDLVGDDENDLGDLFYRDRRSGFVVRANGAVPDQEPFDINTLAHLPFLDQFTFSSASDFGPFLNPSENVFVVEPDPDSPQTEERDLNLDGDTFDSVLQVVDIGGEEPEVLNLDPAQKVVVVAGDAAYLRPEGDVGGGADVLLNDDLDSDDAVVQLYEKENGDDVQNLGLAATDLDLSERLVLALVSEAGEGEDFNSDEDMDDDVLFAIDRATSTPYNTGVAADALGVVDVDTTESAIVGISPEVAQDEVANGDGAQDDRILKLWSSASPPVPVPVQDAEGREQPAEEFVLGSELLAFRTREGDFCNERVEPETCSELPAGCESSDECDLNGDGDCCDDGMQIVVLETGELINTGSAAVKCDFEVCPRNQPYRVDAKSVRFLVDEVLDGSDLNDDGDMEDLLSFIYNIESDGLDLVAAVQRPAEDGTDPTNAGIDPLSNPPFDGGANNSQIAIQQGVCVDPAAGGDACASGGDCGVGEVCVFEDGEGSCRPSGATCRLAGGFFDDCAPGEECADVDAVVSITDADQDEVPDALDNCVRDANTDQADADQDGVGDVCDLQTCGDGVIDLDPLTNAPLEECDDGNILNGDGCSEFCRIGGCFGDVDLDGEIDDQDVDLFDDVPGCFACGGPGCAPQCDGNDDGLVNNIDALLLQGVLGTECEPPPPPPPPGGSLFCGLGFELAALVPLWAALRTRRRARLR